MVCVHKFAQSHNLVSDDFMTDNTSVSDQGNTQVCFNVTAMTDDILEATQSYSIDLTSSNAKVDPAAANLTINILDVNGTLALHIHISLSL